MVSFSPPPGKRALVDLNEWKGHRVLARKGGVFLSGVIKQIAGVDSLGVQFDGEKDVVYFENVFERRDEVRVISDSSPPAAMLQYGELVCVRSSAEENEFHTGKICGKSQQPVMYQVELSDGGGGQQNVWMSRANIRLLKPPWYEDLEEEEELMRIIPPAPVSAISAGTSSVVQESEVMVEHQPTHSSTISEERMMSVPVLSPINRGLTT